VVVEVCVALTRRSRQSELELSGLLPQLAFGLGDGRAEFAVEQRFDVRLLDNVGDVRGICESRRLRVLDREPRAQLDAGFEASEEEATRKRAAAREQVEQAEAGVGVGELRPFLRADNGLVGRATGTVQLPAPSR
jgi:hypothetical protein